ncbi:MAG: hypothetical protein EOP84_02855 [Verrucomicrobiaceae bacterium]|nr:MAG: hypothetical protein EOP84_02855 [Verrucomicrobiaceae bacterium]
MISDATYHQGAVLAMLADRIDPGLHVRRIAKQLSGFYLIGDRLPVLIKFSRNRRGPWSFTFTGEQQLAQVDLAGQYGNLVVCLVCGTDGVAGVDFRDFRKLLDENVEMQGESVSVRRGLNEMYALRGKDGELDRKISRDQFIKIIADAMMPANA